MNNESPYDVEAARAYAQLSFAIPCTTDHFPRLAPQDGIVPDEDQGEWVEDAEKGRLYPRELIDFTDEQWDAIYASIARLVPQDGFDWTESV